MCNIELCVGIADAEKNMSQILPEAVEDAMTVATKLGFWCLRVDRYCMTNLMVIKSFAKTLR
jgi:hypothetical protein